MAEKTTAKQLSYTLPREMDLLAAEGLKADLVKLLQDDGNLVIDGSSVERLSTPCVEILVAADAAFTETQRTFEISNPSASLCEAMETLGLATNIEKWSAS